MEQNAGPNPIPNLIKRKVRVPYSLNELESALESIKFMFGVLSIILMDALLWQRGFSKGPKSISNTFQSQLGIPNPLKVVRGSL